MCASMFPFFFAQSGGSLVEYWCDSTQSALAFRKCAIVLIVVLVLLGVSVSISLSLSHHFLFIFAVKMESHDPMHLLNIH